MRKLRTENEHGAVGTAGKQDPNAPRGGTGKPATTGNLCSMPDATMRVQSPRWPDAGAGFPAFGPALTALHEAGRPLVDAARLTLSGPSGGECQDAATVLVAALRGLRDAWRVVERNVGALGSAAGAALDDWIGTLHRTLPDADGEDDDAANEAADEEDAALHELPDRWRPLCDVWEPTTLASVIAEPESAARQWAAQALLECPATSPWTLDLSECALYSLALPAPIRAAVLGKLAAAECAAGEALAILDPDAAAPDVCRRVAAVVAGMGE